MAKILFFVFLFASLGNCEYELKLVQTVFRHGARAPLLFPYFPSEPPNTRVPWKYGLGQLTDFGMNMEYELGKKYWQMYGEYLNYTYNDESIYVKAGESNRTIQSGDLMLMGMFETILQPWNKNFKWRPLPVHTDRLLEDTMAFEIYRFCPIWWNQNKKENENFEKNLLKNYTPIMQFISEKANMSIANLTLLVQVMSDLDVRIQHQNDHPIPEWLQNNKTLQTDLQDIFRTLEFSDIYDFPNILELASGWLFDQILSQIDYAIMDTSKHKFIAYSGHDHNVNGLGKALKLPQFVAPYLPMYGSHMNFELWKHLDTKQYFVEIKYGEHYNATDEPQNIPNCKTENSTLCPLDDFKNIVSEFLKFKDFGKFCNGKEKKENTDNENPNHMKIIIGLSALSGVLFMIIIVFIGLYIKRRRRTVSFDYY